MNFELRMHPNILFAYTPNHVDLIIRVENKGKEGYWAEADVFVPQKLSLAPASALRKGRMRVGIIGPGEFVEKAVKVYADTYTNPQMYRCKVSSFFFNKNGVIDKRQDKTIDVRCEIKKREVL